MLSPHMTRKEIAVYHYFNDLQVMAFDKAKELLENEKEAYKYSALWPPLSFLLCTFAYAEKAYYSLQFTGFSTKWPIRNNTKETIKNVYASCKGELNERVLAQLSLNKDAGEKSIDAHFEDTVANTILPLLAQLCQIRIKLIAFYEGFAVNVENCNQIDHKCDSLNSIKSLSSEFKSTSSNMNSMCSISKVQVIKPLMNLVREEIDIFMHLLSAELKIREFKYFDALLDLQSANIVIKKWSTYSFSEGRFFAKRQQFPLVVWFTRLYEGLTAKFTFYFHSVILANAPLSPQVNTHSRFSSLNNDLKPFPIKSLDIHLKIMTFQKKNPCYTIGLASTMLYPTPNGSEKIPCPRKASRQFMNNAWGYALPNSVDFDQTESPSDFSRTFGSHHHLHRLSQSHHCRTKKRQRNKMVLAYTCPTQASECVGSGVWWSGICQHLHDMTSNMSSEESIDIRERPVAFTAQTNVPSITRQSSSSSRHLKMNSVLEKRDSSLTLPEAGSSAETVFKSRSNTRTGSLGKGNVVDQVQNCLVVAQAIDSDASTLLVVVSNNGKIFTNPLIPSTDRLMVTSSTPSNNTTIECLADITALSSQSIQGFAVASTALNKQFIPNRDSIVNALFAEIVPILRLERAFGLLKNSMK